jgi:hypothetical protein
MSAKPLELNMNLQKLNSDKSFFKDLKRGKEVEDKALKIIQNKYPCACIVDGFKGYDIWIPEIHKSVEVKYDPMSNETGNVVIEIEFNNKASALITTTADYWIFYDDKKFITLTPMEIVNCIFVNKLVYVSFVGNGDMKSKKSFLVPKELLFNCGKEMKSYDHL